MRPCVPRWPEQILPVRGHLRTHASAIISPASSALYDIPAGPAVTLHMDPLLFATTATALSDTHLPSEVQAISATQSAREEHEPRQTLVALHLYGVQSVGGASLDSSVWSPSHNTPDGTQSCLARSHLNWVPQSESVAHNVPQTFPEQA